MSAAAVLKAEGLRVGYGGKPVVLDVGLELTPNEVLCVIGHNGAGKSTLMRTLFGLVPPEAGQVLVDGAKLGSHVPRALAAHGIAMVPEGRGIFPGLTVKENLCARHVVGRRAGGRARCARRLGAVGAAAGAELLRQARGPAVGRPAADGVDRPRDARAAALPVDGRAVDRAGAEAVPGSAAADPRAAAAAAA